MHVTRANRHVIKVYYVVLHVNYFELLIRSVYLLVPIANSCVNSVLRRNSERSCRGPSHIPRRSGDRRQPLHPARSVEGAREPTARPSDRPRSPRVGSRPRGARPISRGSIDHPPRSLISLTETWTPSGDWISPTRARPATTHRRTHRDTRRCESSGCVLKPPHTSTRPLELSPNF